MIRTEPPRVRQGRDVHTWKGTGNEVRNPDRKVAGRAILLDWTKTRLGDMGKEERES